MLQIWQQQAKNCAHRQDGVGWDKFNQSVTEQNLADRVRYILRSNIFGDAELERLRREAVPSSDGNATAGNAAPLIAQQTANVDAAVNIPFVVDSDDDGIVPHELEKMRSILEESMLKTRSMPLENRLRLPPYRLASEIGLSCGLLTKCW
ncbi:unnamed protein product [Parnassius apollo]|uniref:(apollo) hypothetical protein n=1 Tax=Parnassius apollo TaxID=110799 RepID=A0A8S3Y1J2_PARAO|nr:unnamed protein product [Parnassius apollo]